MEHIEGKPVSASTYNNHRCRCAGCKKEWADYMRPRLRAHRAKKKAQKEGTDQKVRVSV
jgi:hypothetical protein